MRHGNPWRSTGETWGYCRFFCRDTRNKSYVYFIYVYEQSIIEDAPLRRSANLDLGP